MNVRDLIPWTRGGRRPGENALTTAERNDDGHPFLVLHREMNRLFDDVFRDFGAPTLGRQAWPSLEVSEDDKAIRVSAELPGMEEDDVDVVFDDGVLVRVTADIVALSPPLIVERPHIDRIVETLTDAIRAEAA